MDRHDVTGVARVFVIALALLSLAVTAAPCQSPQPMIAERYPAAAIQTTTPEAAGWSVEKLAAAKSWSQQFAPTAAVMIIHHGLIVSEWGDTAIKSDLLSVRKSLLSALVGIAVDEHKLDLNTTMASLGIDDNAPALTPAEKTATVGDLLKARSGIYHSALYEDPEAARQRPPRGSHLPGTFWYYNNWDFNALGTIYERATGELIFTAFENRIARPIGMQDYQPNDGKYVRGSASDHPAYPIRMSTRDLARFALLYLHDGSWNGRQIVPSAWVRESTLSYSRTLPEFGPRLGTGYGYLWWIGFPNDVTLGVPMVNVPVRSFAAVGAQGQFALVMPAHDLVIVQRINTDVPIGSPPGQRKPAPSTRQMARLIWLLLSAAGVDDVGPDASLAHATGKHLEGEALKTALAGTTLVIGGTLAGGARVWQLSADGHLSILIGAERREFRNGTWRVDGDHFCRTLIGTSVQDSCLSVVVKDYGFQFFDANGLMEFDARTE